jgi:hypothetical protein
MGDLKQDFCGSVAPSLPHHGQKKRRNKKKNFFNCINQRLPEDNNVEQQ